MYLWEIDRGIMSGNLGKICRNREFLKSLLRLAGHSYDNCNSQNFTERKEYLSDPLETPDPAPETTADVPAAFLCPGYDPGLPAAGKDRAAIVIVRGDTTVENTSFVTIPALPFQFFLVKSPLLFREWRCRPRAGKT
jgi:hypothetical protein